ncbi:DUF1349 domain-containing protein [Salisediminibacterium halotolerans]|uniref:Regulation of enolase protein 1, concanavalin A-like superfamily n=1 Tax=Salisediminibacterium halotolerans TaxID=517425 RepID=A0A1H9VX59_9BACI|nr:DUF1349 domain-containing protein [Salisediminibacterium haloalkalitolerans]SES25947.1 hypothetical protein SAMN05444126_12439 [Salisediminibacterium haloalkalitolerans]
MKTKMIFNDYFEGNRLSDELSWFCEPDKWFIDTHSSQLVLKTDKNTDYWQKTHYGFQADNGHFLYREINKNFRLTTKVSAKPESKYDQAGLMLRVTEDEWVKTSLEYIPDGSSKLGAVVTKGGYSDWSSQPAADDQEYLYYRISRIGANIYVDVSLNGAEWKQIRVAHLDIPEHSSVKAGLYACSPQGEGQEVRFDYIEIEELSDDPQEAYL